MKKILLITLLFLTACAAPMQERAVLATPNSNDVTLSGGNYGALTYKQDGTEADPVIVWGNGSTAQCVRVEGDWITVRDLKVEGCNDHGILVSGKHVTIENNEVTRAESDRFNPAGYCYTSGGFGSAIKGMVGSEDLTIRENLVYKNCGEGIAVTRVKGALVENNIVFDNHNVDIYIDNSFDVTVRGNQIACDEWAVSPGTNGNGIALGQENYGSEWGKQLHDVLIRGNTISGCRLGIAAFSSIGTLRNVRIEENLIPSGLHRAISLLQPSCVGCSIIGNGVFWLEFLYPSSGVTVSGNYLYTGNVTNTPAPATATRTPTVIPPTFTSTPEPGAVCVPVFDVWVCNRQP